MDRAEAGRPVRVPQGVHDSVEEGPGRGLATVYLDLFAGQAENVSRSTGAAIMGSARRALETVPPFSKVMLFEQPARAAGLKSMLRREYPGRDLVVYAGDRNVRVVDALQELANYRAAPTFAFVDQEGAEVQWTTLQRIAAHKTTRTKIELWLYFATGLLPRGLVAEAEMNGWLSRSPRWWGRTSGVRSTRRSVGACCRRLR